MELHCQGARVAAGVAGEGGLEAGHSTSAESGVGVGVGREVRVVCVRRRRGPRRGLERGAAVLSARGRYFCVIHGSHGGGAVWEGELKQDGDKGRAWTA